MDQTHDAVVVVPPVGQLAGRRPEETGGIPHLPSQAQAPTCRAKSQARNQLQHPPNQTAIVQSSRLHAHRRQNGLCTYHLLFLVNTIIILVDVGHRQRLERFGRRRKVVRRVAPVRNDAPGTSRTSRPEVQAQGRRPRGMDSRQGGDAPVAGLQTVPSQRAQGA